MTVGNVAARDVPRERRSHALSKDDLARAVLEFLARKEGFSGTAHDFRMNIVELGPNEQVVSVTFELEAPRKAGRPARDDPDRTGEAP